MANKLKETRIRLPPIDGSVHDLVTGFPLNRKDSEKGRNVSARQQCIAVGQSNFFPPLVQPVPSRQKLHIHDGRKSLGHQQMKITHTEKIPTQFPGKKFAVLPPIGSSCRQEKNIQQSDKKPSAQPRTGQKPEKVLKKTDSTESKASDGVSKPTSAVIKPKRGIKKQMSVFGLANADRKQEYKVRNNSPEDPQMSSPSKTPNSQSLTKAKGFHQKSVLNDDDGNDGDDDDDDSTMMKLFEVLQFLEWSSELREFLNGRNSGRRNATCCSLDPMLSQAVDIIRDILLKQTMEELCMMW